jgi:hypothetical protein
MEPYAWDAWDGARRDEAVDAARRHPALLADADAEKWAGREPGVREWAVRVQAARFQQLELRLEQWVQPDAAAELYRPGEDQSEEQ